MLAITRIRRREMKLLMKPAILNLLFVFSVALDQCFGRYSTPEAAWVCRIAILMQFVLARVLAFEYIRYILHLIEKNGAVIEDQHIYSIVKWAGMIPVLLNMVYPFLYRITEENRLVELPGSFIQFCVEISTMGIVAGVILRYREHMNRDIAALCALYCGALSLSLAVLMTTPLQMTIFPFFTTLGTVFISMRRYSDMIKEYYRQDVEFREVKNNRVITTMRPHFLYNALSSISQLSKYDPGKASEMTDRFSEFLHSNVNAMHSSEPIPFNRELRAVENYLEIEKMRFGEDMNILYRIEDRDFNIPPMVMQPLLENAIKHGLGGREDGGTLLITARKCFRGHIVTISDDGVGYESEKPTPREDGRAHLGLASARTRMEQIPGAMMLHSSTPMRGTTVTIILPDPAEAVES